MKILIALLLILLSPGQSRILPVGPSRAFTTIQQAAATALPGDTILVDGGMYQGGEYLTNVQGTPASWIHILAAPQQQVIFRGGTEAWHLTDVAYLRISGFIFENQTGNGVNIDDGGSYDTPSHRLIIENCEWRALNATGNNDQLKLSGVDTFIVRSCRFIDGSLGGSAVDMVGCHQGQFVNNHFENCGSNAIQSKGGSQNIRIEMNRFIRGGQRALNIGGSTGAQYFRPLNANFEASHIAVYSNVFTGSTAPIAYVGAVQCEVVNNTFYRPEKWAIRILQETTGPNYLPCGNNIFRNNIVYLGNAAANPTINIGPNTKPETFLFSNNLWFNFENANWQGPNLPATESNGIIGTDPLFPDAANNNFSVRLNSPAVGKGMSVAEPRKDFSGNTFNTPRSIGAVEGNPTVTSVDDVHANVSLELRIYPNPIHHGAMISFSLSESDQVMIMLHDVLGRSLQTIYRGELSQGFHVIPLVEKDVSTTSLRGEIHWISLRTSRAVEVRKIIFER